MRDESLERIAANSLRADVSFLASNELEGRGTPSNGLDLAAEFIRSKFRANGLLGSARGDYLQSIQLVRTTIDRAGFRVRFYSSGRTVNVAFSDVKVLTPVPAEVLLAPVYDFNLSHVPGPGSLKGRVVVVQMRDFQYEVRNLLNRAHPAAVIIFTRLAIGGNNEHYNIPLPEATYQNETPPYIIVNSSTVIEEYAALSGGGGTTVEVRLRVNKEWRSISNVIGVLPGADPTFRNQYVLVTSHYDHLGKRSGQIYYGANDDASGTASVIEIAGVLARMTKHPRRTVIFICFAGEEEHLMGSAYYVQHPMFPLARTIAVVNLEQLGRTDGDDGEVQHQVSFTGASYSNVFERFERAAQIGGIRLDASSAEDAAHFEAGDNLSFAKAGIPAHTVYVVFRFPDYHRVSDTWQKIDYDNMADVDQMLAFGIIDLANHSQAPRWSRSSRLAIPFSRIHR
jgi:hypothetical protein